MRRAGTVAATLLLLAGGCSFAGGGEAARALHIGVDLPLTGSEAGAAAPVLDGMRFYVERHPSIDGFAVSLVVADDAAGGDPNPERGRGNVQSFLADPLVVGMLGPLDASVARREIPAANAASLAMVAPATSSPCLTRDDFLPAPLNPERIAITCASAALPSAAELRPAGVNNFFRLATTDDLQGPAAADYAFHTLHLLRAAVVSDHETYGQALADGFSARFTALGGSVVARLDLDSTAKQLDPSTFLQGAKAAGAQAVYFGGTAASGGCRLRAGMASVFDPGDSTPFLGGDGLVGPSCVRDAGGNEAGILATAPIVDAGTLPGAAAIVAAYRQAFPAAADYSPYTMLAYDATATLYAAVDRAIRASGNDLPVRGNVVSQLSALTGLAGVTGTIGFDASGDTLNRVLTLYAPASSDPGSAWKAVASVDYRTEPPY